ncbi:MAG TPA: hypothetical protein VGS22_18615 [Thermoanaerobaculia bacterium]|jgi:hypothetical protein|nr:hypothetical protein [Thermoanaerobaculia bacterium]
MTRKLCLFALLALAATLLAAPASASPQYSFAVKFVCGYNPENVGRSLDGNREGEPTVKFGNYATDINIFNQDYFSQADIRKKVILLVKEGSPEGREPRLSKAIAFDGITLQTMQATMDDCNRIAELIYGGVVPTPMPLLIGFLVLESNIDLSVTAVYTAETCSNWINSPEKLECLDASGKHQGVGISIDVEQIKSRQLF